MQSDTPSPDEIVSIYRFDTQGDRDRAKECILMYARRASIAARQGSPDGLANEFAAWIEALPVSTILTLPDGLALRVELALRARQPAGDVETVQHITQAMAVALRRDCTNPRGECYAVTSGPCPQEGGWPTEVDGEFDLENLAKAAIAAMPAPAIRMAPMQQPGPLTRADFTDEPEPAPAITEAMVADGARGLCRNGGLCVGFCHAINCHQAVEQFGDEARACLTAALGQRP